MQKCVLLLLAEGGAVHILITSALWTETFLQHCKKFSTLDALVKVMDHNGGVEEEMKATEMYKVVVVCRYLFPLAPGSFLSN